MIQEQGMGTIQARNIRQTNNNAFAGHLSSLKEEVSQELGVHFGPEGTNRDKTSYECGIVGGEMTKRVFERFTGQYRH